MATGPFFFSDVTALTTFRFVGCLPKGGDPFVKGGNEWGATGVYAVNKHPYNAPYIAYDAGRTFAASLPVSYGTKRRIKTTSLICGSLPREAQIAHSSCDNASYATYATRTQPPYAARLDCFFISD